MADEAPEQTFYLIDGHAQIFRAYYAIRSGLSSPTTGEPTHAVFAFATMLLKLLHDYGPDYVAVAIDMPGKTFRDDLYAEYKANRDSPPDDFAPQVDRIFQMIRLFGIPLLGVAGFEADDVIATVMQHVLDDEALEQVNLRIVSKDKDLEQLLGDRAIMFDIHTDAVIDVDWLQEHRGIGPHQVVELLTLTGDTVDNVPGVEGVGPKTAAKLLQEYGSIDGIYENIDKIKGKRHEKLEAARQQMPLSRTLVTLRRDVELDVNLEQMRVGPIDAAALRQLFAELGLRRQSAGLDELIAKLPADAVVNAAGEPRAERKDAGDFSASLFESANVESGGASAIDELADEDLTTAEQFDYTAVTTRAQLDELVGQLRGAKVISVDTETTGLSRTADLCGLCFSWQAGHGVYVPMRSPAPEKHLDPATVLEALGPLLEDRTIGKCGHNLKYDWLMLRRAGVELRGIVFDSMVGAFLLNSPARGLDMLVRQHFKHAMIPISALIGPGDKDTKQITMVEVPLEQLVPYAAEDADMALRLYELMWPQLQQRGMGELCTAVEMPLVEVLGRMQHTGVKIDPSVLDQQRTDLEAKIIDLRERIFELSGGPFNLDSPKQLARVLFTHLKMPVIKRTKTGVSTDAQVLEQLADLEDADNPGTSVPRLIVEYRTFSKLVSTYLGNLVSAMHKETGRIHASFNQTGAATGRLSSGGPNLQNIPVRTEVGRQVRKAFVADDGWVLISADYSQIELRILAHLSEDEALIEAFRTDQDIHASVAAQVFDVPIDQVTSSQRAAAKVINFGIIYGVTAYGLARRIEGLDVEAAKKLIVDYRKRFAGIDRFLQQCVQQAMDVGYVTTIMGRRRLIPQIQSTNGSTRALGERLAINTVVQGSATADLIKLAMVNLQKRIEDEYLPIRILMQIHDELVVEAPKERAEQCADEVRQVMESAMELRVPLKVDVGVGEDWLTAK